MPGMLAVATALRQWRKVDTPPLGQREYTYSTGHPSVHHKFNNILIGIDMSETLQKEVATLIVDTLNLDISPAEIVPDQPLFREGLGLDSIDALELAMAISRDYGFQLRSDDSENGKILASLAALTAHIEANRT